MKKHIGICNMKIVKKHCIEIWFSPKRRMERYMKPNFDGTCRIRFISSNEFHRKIGPAMIFGDGECLFVINGQHYRINGPNYIDNQKKPIDWHFKGKSGSEETYWNM